MFAPDLAFFASATACTTRSFISASCNLEAVFFWRVALSNPVCFLYLANSFAYFASLPPSSESELSVELVESVIGWSGALERGDWVGDTGDTMAGSVCTNEHLAGDIDSAFTAFVEAAATGAAGADWRDGPGRNEFAVLAKACVILYVVASDDDAEWAAGGDGLDDAAGRGLDALSSACGNRKFDFEGNNESVDGAGKSDAGVADVLAQGRVSAVFSFWLKFSGSSSSKQTDPKLFAWSTATKTWPLLL